MAQWGSEALQNHLSSNLAVPKTISASTKLLGEESPSVATPAILYVEELSASLL